MGDMLAFLVLVLTTVAVSTYVGLAITGCVKPPKFFQTQPEPKVPEALKPELPRPPLHALIKSILKITESYFSDSFCEIYGNPEPVFSLMKILERFYGIEDVNRVKNVIGSLKMRELVERQKSKKRNRQIRFRPRTSIYRYELSKKPTPVKSLKPGVVGILYHVILTSRDVTLVFSLLEILEEFYGVATVNVVKERIGPYRMKRLNQRYEDVKIFQNFQEKIAPLSQEINSLPVEYYGDLRKTPAEMQAKVEEMQNKIEGLQKLAVEESKKLNFREHAWWHFHQKVPTSQFIEVFLYATSPEMKKFHWLPDDAYRDKERADRREDFWASMSASKEIDKYERDKKLRPLAERLLTKEEALISPVDIEGKEAFEAFIDKKYDQASVYPVLSELLKTNESFGGEYRAYLAQMVKLKHKAA